MIRFEDKYPLMFYTLLVTFIMICSLFVYKNNINNYEYVDKDGYIGYSKKCIIDTPYSICYTSDNKKIKILLFYEFEK